MNAKELAQRIYQFFGKGDLQVVAFYVFAVHPPREVEQQFLEPAPLAPLLSDPQALRRQLFRFAGAPISYQ